MLLVRIYLLVVGTRQTCESGGDLKITVAPSLPSLSLYTPRPCSVKRGKISAGSGSSSDHQQQQKHSSEQHNTFLVLKLENVKSQTPPLKGDDPVWDEDFLL